MDIMNMTKNELWTLYEELEDEIDIMLEDDQLEDEIKHAFERLRAVNKRLGAIFEQERQQRYDEQFERMFGVTVAEAEGLSRKCPA